MMDLSLLTPMALTNAGKIRIGAKHDGGYVMVDDFPRGMLALSIGVGRDVSWDIGMAARQLRVRQYDPTISNPPTEFEFHALGLSSIDCEGHRSLASLLTEPAIVKIDIEGDEWKALEYADLMLARQLVVEFHHMGRMAETEQAQRVFANITTTHQVVHVHANNYGGMSTVPGLPETLEITFASRAYYAFETNFETFPTWLDNPNNLKLPDIELGRFKW